MPAALRLDDLMGRGQTGPETTKLMNVKVPGAILDRLAKLARKLRTSKTEVVVAILNEGLDQSRSRTQGLEGAAEAGDPQEPPLADRRL